MRVEFDAIKDSANRLRHGVSLSFAERLDWDAALVWVDTRFQYSELRMSALVPEGSVLYFVAFVERGDIQRIISLRQATRKEVEYYVQNS